MKTPLRTHKTRSAALCSRRGHGSALEETDCSERVGPRHFGIATLAMGIIPGIGQHIREGALRA